MKGFETHIFPLSLKTSLNQSWVLTVGKNEYNHVIGYMSINSSRDVVISLACYSYSKSVRLGKVKSVENDV